MNFIASMRMLLGALNLGPNAVMEKLIEENLIKPAKLLALRGDANRDDLLDNIDAFEKLIKADKFDEKALKAARSVRSSIPGKTEDDLVSEIYYKLVEEGWSIFANHFSPEKNMNAVEFMNYYTIVVNNLLRNIHKEYDRKKKHESQIGDVESEEGDILPGGAIFTKDPIWQKPMTPIEKAEQEKGAEHLKHELLNYIAKKDPNGKHGIYYAFLLVWLDTTLGKEISKVDVKNMVMKSPLIQRIAEEEGLESQTIEVMFGELKRWILDFYEKKTNIRITDRFKRWLKVSSEHRLILACKRVAELILIGVDGGFITPKEELEVIRAEMKKNKDNHIED